MGSKVVGSWGFKQRICSHPGNLMEYDGETMVIDNGNKGDHPPNKGSKRDDVRGFCLRLLFEAY